MRILFVAETLYQLFNVVIMRMNEHENDCCDLVLAHQTKWNPEIVRRLQFSGLFNRVLQVDASKDQQEFYQIADLAERKRIYANPDAFFRRGVFAEPEYDVLFLPLDHLAWKMFFYYSAACGKRPRIHMYDEGLRAYTMPIMESESPAYMKGVYQAQDAFPASIEAYHLHRPQLYSVPNPTFQLIQIPSPTANDECRRFLIDLYGSGTLPDEKYIYLEDYFFADRFPTNDFDLFKGFAEMVGRENVIVKRHPRDSFDRFAPWGYREVPDSGVPWESQLLANDYTRKVLVSVTSTSLMTPFLIFDFPMHVVSLENMFAGESRTHQDKAFVPFMNAFRAMANAQEIYWHSPRSLKELRETLRFVNLKLA